LPDCPECGAHVPESDDHHDKDIEFTKTDPGGPRKAQRKSRFHVPWGLFILLGGYAAVSYTYIHFKDLDSPQYRAAMHLRSASQILGKDSGSSATNDQLLEAYNHLIESLILFPDDRWAHDQLEKVEWTLAVRGRKPPPELKRRADMLASAYQNIQAGRTSVLPVGPRDIWDIDAVVDAPGRLVRYFTFGGLVIILLWSYKEFQDYQFHRKHEDEKHLDRREDLRDLDSHRRR
jgi:hypothetical protein